MHSHFFSFHWSRHACCFWKTIIMLFLHSKSSLKTTVFQYARLLVTTCWMWVYSCKTIVEKLQYQLKPLDASVVLKTYCDREAHEWNNSWAFSLFTAEKSGRASLFIWSLHHVGLGVGVCTCMCTRMYVCVRFPGCDETVPRSQSINNAEQPKHV